MAPTYRIGQIVPSSNTTMETEVPAIFRSREAVRPERFTFHSSRMRMTTVAPAELERMNGQTSRCAAELADARVDVISTACLVAVMASGPGRHREAAREIESCCRDNGSQARALTSAGALIEGLQILGARRIALLAPYTHQLATVVVEYIEREGITVADWRSFGIEDNLAVGRRDPLALIEDVKQLDTGSVDAVVLSACVQMPSLPAIEQVERSLDVPVVSTAVCTARRMLDALDLEPYAPGAGALLSGEYPNSVAFSN